MCRKGAQAMAWPFELFPWCDIAWRWRTRFHVGPEGTDLQVGLRRLFERRVLVERFEVVLDPRFFPLQKPSYGF